MWQALRDLMALSTEDARAILRRLFRDHPDRRFAFRLWDGAEVDWGVERDFTIVFEDRETFRRCLVSGDPAEFAEAYVDGRLQIEGDLWSATSIGSYLRVLEPGVRDKVRFGPKLVVPTSRHTIEHDRRDVQAHYDLSDDFFRLFLDERMIYSCAYFAAAGQRLEDAQARKLDLVCRKLALRPGERLLDVGCGWGGLVMWAAAHYGVEAHGITLSEHQLEEARRRVAEAGLADRVTIELRHYAELPEEAFDKVSSVGMSEHVGVAKLPAYFGAVRRALRPGGYLLNHCITDLHPSRGATGGAFIFRHVFPGAELTPVAELIGHIEATSFEVIDVQSLRPHYALTLREWFRRFSERRAEAGRLVPARVLRIWELYLAGCARAFEEALIGVHQVLAVKPDAHGRAPVPLARPEQALGSVPG